MYRWPAPSWWHEHIQPGPACAPHSPMPDSQSDEQLINQPNRECVRMRVYSKSYLIWRAVHSAELFKVLFNSYLNALIGLSVFQPLPLHQLIEEWLESCQKIISECFKIQIWARCECVQGSHPDVFKQYVRENLHWLVNNSLQRWLSSLGDVLTTKGVTQMTALHKTPTEFNTGFKASGVVNLFFYYSFYIICIILGCLSWTLF